MTTDMKIADIQVFATVLRSIKVTEAVLIWQETFRSTTGQQLQCQQAGKHQFNAAYVSPPHAIDLVPLPKMPSFCDCDRLPASNAASLNRLNVGGIQLLASVNRETTKCQVLCIQVPLLKH